MHQQAFVSGLDMTQYRSLLNLKCIGSRWFSFLFVFSSKPDSVTSNSFPDFTWPWLELEAHPPPNQGALLFLKSFETSSRDVGCWLTATDFTDVTLAIEDINCWRWRVMLGIKIEYIWIKIVKEGEILKELEVKRCDGSWRLNITLRVQHWPVSKRREKHFAYFKTWTGIARKVNFQQKKEITFRLN